MDSVAIEDEAARWFVKRQTGSWTTTDQVQFDAWIGQHTAHRIAYIRLEAAWQHSARLKALRAGVPANTIPPRETWDHARLIRNQADTHPREDAPLTGQTRFRRTYSLATAATVLLLVIGAYLYQLGFLTGERYTTPVGGLQNVALKDGSHITLNTDTSLRATVTGEKERRIRLDRGEAFFEVAHDAKRTFIVYAGSKRITAVGTQFSVRVIPAKAGILLASWPGRGSDVQVAVTEGVVKVESSLLPAGSIASTVDDEINIRQDAAAQVENLLSWRTGYVNFRDVALADAVAEFNRYNTRKIYIEDPDIAAIHVTAKFRSNNTDAFLYLIENGFPIKVEQNDERIILRRR